MVGWGPTVIEINNLLQLFDEIYHVAVLHMEEAPKSALPYASEKIHFVPIRPFGGPMWQDKLKTLKEAPSVIQTVRKVLDKVDFWQFRAPTGIGVFLVPYLSLFTSKPGWFKYAGNWGQTHPPLGYRFQKFWLQHLQKRKVTINGRWPGQPAHCLSFENPCLSEEERKIGKTIVCSKNYKTRKRTICFVGHLNEAKGAHWLLDALPLLSPNEIEAFHLIGDGPLRSKFEHLIPTLDFTIVLHGYCPRHRVSEIMQLCHLILLPSKSEGFPKVIAEGANYGCVPVVSDISTLSQYIHHGENGFLLSPRRLQGGFLFEDLQKILNLNDLSEIAFSAYSMAEAFTYERYAVRIQNEILSVEK